MIQDIARIAVLAVLLIFVRGLWISFLRFRHRLELVDAAILLVGGVSAIAARRWFPILLAVAVGYPLMIVAELMRKRYDRVSTRGLTRHLLDHKYHGRRERYEAAVIKAAVNDGELKKVLARFSAKNEDLVELHQRMLSLGIRPSDAETALHSPEVLECFFSKSGARTRFTVDLAVEFVGVVRKALLRQQ